MSSSKNGFRMLGVSVKCSFILDIWCWIVWSIESISFWLVSGCAMAHLEDLLQWVWGFVCLVSCFSG